MKNFEGLKEEYYKAKDLMLESYDSESDEFDDRLSDEVDKLRDQLMEIIDPENREQVLFALQNQIYWNLDLEHIIPEKFGDDIEVLVEAINTIDEDLDFSLEQENDVPLMKSLIEETVKAWFYAGEKVRDNEECLYAYLNNGGNPAEIKKCSDRIKSDPEVALNIIKNIDAKKEKYRPHRYEAPFIQERLYKNGVFSYLAPNIKKMENVILEATKVYGKSMKWEIDKDLRNNPEFMKKFNEALEEWKAKGEKDSTKNKEEYYQEIINKVANSVKYVYDEYGDWVGLGEIADIRMDYNIVPKELWENEDFCLMWINNSGVQVPWESTANIHNISDKLLDNKEFIEKACVQNPKRSENIIKQTIFKDDDNFIIEIERKIKENELKEKMQESDELDTTLEKVEQLENIQDSKITANNLDEEDSGEQK